MIVLSLGKLGFRSRWMIEVSDLRAAALISHQVVAPHLQDVHQLLQQAGVKEGLDKKTAFWRVWKYYYFAIIPGSSLSVGCCR